MMVTEIVQAKGLSLFWSNDLHLLKCRQRFSFSRKKLKTGGCLSPLLGKECDHRTASPANARASIIPGTSYSVVNITCIEGYQPVNSSLNTRVCLASGVWSDENTEFCERRRCPDKINLPPGSIFVDGKTPKEHRFGTKISVTCNKGFTKITGSDTVQCSSSGDWEWNRGRLLCQAVTCTDPRISQSGSRLEGAKSGVFQVSSKISFSCKAGYQLIGNASSTCREDGTWSSLPTCKCSSTFWEFSDICVCVSIVWCEK